MCKLADNNGEPGFSSIQPNSILYRSINIQIICNLESARLRKSFTWAKSQQVRIKKTIRVELNLTSFPKTTDV